MDDILNAIRELFFFYRNEDLGQVYEWNATKWAEVPVFSRDIFERILAPTKNRQEVFNGFAMTVD
jgi:hypothetical protein